MGGTLPKSCYGRDLRVCQYCRLDAARRLPYEVPSGNAVRLDGVEFAESPRPRD